MNGAKVSIGSLPEGWYITSFNVSSEYGTQTSLTIGDNPIYKKCTVKYNWVFKGATIERTLKEISNARIYFDYSVGIFGTTTLLTGLSPKGLIPLRTITLLSTCFLKDMVSSEFRIMAG